MMTKNQTDRRSNPRAGLIVQALDRLRAAATPRNILIALILYLGSIALLTLSDMQIERYAPGITKPDLQFGYTYSAVMDTFSEMGADGRRAYGGNLIIDSVMPILFAAVTLLTAARAAPRWLGLLAIAPLVFFGLDMVENAAFAYLLSQYPEISPGLVGVVRWITMVKLSAYVIALPTLVLGLIWLLVRGLVRKPLVQA
jgi:hypothetical protein